MKGMGAHVIGLLHLCGGLILYWITLLTFGVKPAIAVALLFIIVDGGGRLLASKPLPPVWLIGNGAAILFGLVDLYAHTPFMIRYEGAIFNLGWAAAFAIGTFGREPLVLKFARQRSPDIPDRPEIIRFFRAFTIAWSLFFVVRTAALLWIMDSYPLTEAIAIRAGFGWISMGAMIFISLNGRRLFKACQRLGLFTSPLG